MPRSTTPGARRLIKLSDVADELDVSVKTVRRYISDGKLPAYRVAGGQIRIRSEDVDKLLQPIPTALIG